MNEIVEEVRQHYDRDVLAEWERLERNPYEFAITCRYLDRYIQPGDRVLDVGGGPGRYTLYLAQRGCDVTLFDLSPRNVAFARERLEEAGLTARCLAGDVLELPARVSGAFDHVLCMGPLYHLLRAEDRERAVRNCLAVCKPGGLAYLAYISVNAAAFYFLREQPAGILDPKEADYFDAFVRGSDFGGQGFTQVHYEAVGRVVPTMEALGLETLHLVGAEGILNPYKHNLAGQAPEVIDRWIELALKICERPDLLGCAEHLLYIGRKGPTCNC